MQGDPAAEPDVICNRPGTFFPQQVNQSVKAKATQRWFENNFNILKWRSRGLHLNPNKNLFTHDPHDIWLLGKSHKEECGNPTCHLSASTCPVK